MLEYSFKIINIKIIINKKNHTKIALLKWYKTVVLLANKINKTGEIVQLKNKIKKIFSN